LPQTWSEEGNITMAYEWDGYIETTAEAPLGAIRAVHPSTRVAFTEVLGEIRAMGIDGDVSERLAAKCIASGEKPEVIVRHAMSAQDREAFNRRHRERLAGRAERLGPRGELVADWLRETR
jgi:hypothetical protein